MNTIFKRMISVLLALTLVLGAVGVTPLKARAEDGESAYTVWDMTEPYEVSSTNIEDGSVVQLNVDVTGLYRFYSVSANIDPWARLYDADMNDLIDSDDSNGGLEFAISAYLMAGQTYFLDFRAYDDVYEYTVMCEKKQLTGMELCDIEPYLLYEELGGEWRYDSDNDSSYYWYNVTDEMLDAVTFQMIFSDGTSETVSYYDLEDSGFDVAFSEGEQEENHWAVGEHFYTVSCNGMTVQIPVIVQEIPFTSFAVTKNPTAKYVLGDVDFFSTSGEEVWLHARILSGMEVSFEKADGSSYVLDYFEMCDEHYEISVESIVVDGAGDYEVSINILGQSGTFTTQVVEKPVGQNVISGTEYTINNAYGYEWFVLEANESADYYVFIDSLDGELYQAYATVFNSDMEEVEYVYDSNDTGYDVYWSIEKGETYYIRTGSSSELTGVTLTVEKERKPKKIEVLDGPIELMLNTNGEHRSNSNGDSYFHYSTDDILAGKTIRITYADGTYLDYGYEQLREEEDVWVYSEQDTSPWVPDKKNILYVECRGLTAEVEVRIKKPSHTVITADKAYTYNTEGDGLFSFVPKVSGYYKFYVYSSISCDPYVTLLDASYGQLAYDDDSGDGLEFCLIYQLEAGQTYYYVIDRYGTDIDAFQFKVEKQQQATSLRLVSGQIELIENVDGNMSGEDEEDFFWYSYYSKLLELEFELTLENGSKHLIRLGDSVEGIYLDVSDDQDSVHWYCGQENYLTFSWLNISIRVPVTIVENPVVGISIINEDVTPEYVLGDKSYMNDSGNGTYDLYPDAYEGLQLKVDYRDGTSQTYAIDGDTGEVNGYSITTEYITVSDVGEYQAIYKYMGNQCTLTIQVVESPITSIEVVAEPAVVSIPSYAMPNFSGMKFKITYTDGEVEEITVKEDMLNFKSWNTVCVINTGDFNIMCYSQWNSELQSVYWVFHALGAECIYEGIQYYERNATGLEVSNITEDGTGMKLTVSFDDQTVENYVIDDPIHGPKGVDYFIGYARIDGYLVPYNVYIANTHPNGVACAGEVYMFGMGYNISREHIVTEVPAKAATCTAEGNITYYKCSCGLLFADAKCTETITSAQLKVAKHTQKYVKAVAATKKKNGNKAHYVCSCGKLYLDAACTKEVSKGDVTLAIVDKTSISKVTSKKKALTVKWKKKSGVTGYEIQVALKKNFKKGLKITTVKGAKKASVTVKSLKTKKAYYVRVRAYKVVNGKKFYSDWSKVVKKKTK